MELARGVKDFVPAEMRVRLAVLDTIREQFRLFGFEPLETPILERLETLNAKMEGSDATDVAKEIFRVTDQGGRDLGLRYDLTVPLARFVAQRKDLKLPFRRYEIGRVYRDGPIKLGRTREFVQCDGDIIGSSSMFADADCINLALAVFDALEIPVVVKVNSRVILDAVCKKVGIANTTDTIISVDKLDKIGRSGVAAELTHKGVSQAQTDELLDLLLIEGTNAGKLSFLEKNLGEAAVQDLRTVLDLLQDEVVFTPSLARGLAYYTGTVYEAFALESAMKSSLMGGGRYDNLIGTLTGGASTPAVGVSFGIEPICTVLAERSLDAQENDTKVLVIPVGNTLAQSTLILRELRKHRIASVMDIMDRSLSKNMDYANKLQIPYALIVGEKELSQGLLTLKDLRSGDEKKIPRDELENLAVELE